VRHTEDFTAKDAKNAKKYSAARSYAYFLVESTCGNVVRAIESLTEVCVVPSTLLLFSIFALLASFAVRRGFE